DEFRRLMKEAGDDVSQLSNLFNLMTYSIEGTNGFIESIRGVPVGPTEEPDQNKAAKWLYRQVVPAYRQVEDAKKLPSIDENYGTNPYSGVGADPRVVYDFLDLFGNPIITEESLEPLTTELRYFDPLIGLGSWPGLEASYQAASDGDGTGTLTATLSISKSAFQDDDGRVDPTQVNNAIETWFQVGNQMLAPGYEAYLISSVAPDVKSQDQASTLVGFVKNVLAYLNDLLAGRGGANAPSAELKLQVSAEQRNETQPENIYEVALQLVLRRTRFVDEKAVEKLSSVTEIRSAISPSANAEKGDRQMALTAFAEGFEKAFPELKAATGNGSAGDTTVFAIRMGKIESGKPGITWSFSPAATLYYAPPPLSNVLLSRDIDVTFPSQNGGAPQPFQQTVAAVDMDVWGRDFLAAVDVFLQPENAVAARNKDAAAFTQVMTSKETLAHAIGSSVTHVLQSQKPAADALGEAQRAFRQRLLVILSSAYEISTVVQPSATVSNSKPSTPPPQLYGSVVDKVSDESGSTAPDISLSPSKLAAGEGTSRLNSLFSVQVPKDQGNVPLDLAYRITHVEYDIEAAREEDQYQSSSWLTLILPPPAMPVGTADVPVALREYPIPPTLNSQAGIPEALAACPKPEPTATDPLQAAKRWQYRFTYTQANVAQDTVLPDVKFNIRQQPGKALLAKAEPDLFDWLALFIAEYPGLEGQLKNPDENETAIARLAYLVEGAANTWEAWVNPQALAGSAVAATAALEEYEYRYLVDERLQENEIRVHWIPVGNNGLAPVFPWIELSLGGEPSQCLAPTVEGEWATYEYQGEDDGQTLMRTLIFPKLDVLNTENGWGGIQLTRNEVLFKNDPAVATNPAFIYKTPLVRFVNQKTPLIEETKALDIGQGLPQKKELAEILGILFQALFSSAEDHTGDGSMTGATRTLQVSCRYAYDVRGGSGTTTGPDEEAAFLVYLPVLSRPPFQFALDTDWDPTNPNSFVSQMVSAIQCWYAEQSASRARSFLLFDVGIFASLSEIQLPILRLRKLWLGVDKISDL
ncbi:MAG: hypothetical protein ABFS23_04415, partial [Pseudomonadota bacterium]